jgi:hypothetical protein
VPEAAQLDSLKRNKEISETCGGVKHASGARGEEAMALVARRSTRVVAASPRSAVLRAKGTKRAIHEGSAHADLTI